ncbi:MAG: hypothetical protein AAF988_09010, partial [Pseudomonadota bacterium]
KTFHIELSQFFDEYAPNNISPQSDIISKLFLFFVSVMLLFLMTWYQLSLSASKFFIKYSLITLLPAFLIALLTSWFLIGQVILFQWPDASFWKGGGFGVAQLILMMNPVLAQESVSFFMIRFFEFGFIGAYGFYILFLIPLSVFFQILTVRRRRKMLARIGVIVMFFVIMADMFWLYHSLMPFILFLGWLVIVSCWGQSGFKTQHLMR